MQRLRDDPRFAIENLYKILDLETSALIPFRFNEAQVRLYEMERWFRRKELPCRIIICKSRRAGLSTGVEGLIYHDTTTRPHRQSLIVANQKNPSENVLKMCRRFWENTPEEFKPTIPREYNNNPPKDAFYFAEPEGSFIVLATAQSVDAYLGYGFQNIHATEAAYYADGAELFRALYATLSKKPDSALYIESTPNGQTGRGEFFYRQCLDMETEVLTRRGFLHHDDISDDDQVAGFDIANQTIRWRPITDHVERPLGPDEQMYTISSRTTDVRVTAGHRMVYGDSKSPWQFTTAEDLSRRARPYVIPAAGYEADVPGVPLSDDELRVIGWYLTDGCVNRTTRQFTIYQAEASPFLDDIRSALDGCGMYYSVYKRSAATQFTRNSAMLSFSVPKDAKRKTHKGKRGWSALAPYFDKDVSPLLERMTAAQLSVLLCSMHMGDGMKQRTRHQLSYHIGTGRKAAADRLQSLCVRRGWRASISVRNTPGLRPFYTLHAREHSVRLISGQSAWRGRGRPSLRAHEAALNERVWCVSNDLNTLVTRRNGKVSIVGNCMNAYENRGRRGEYGVTRLLFIPWHEMKLSFSIPFSGDDKKRSFKKSLTADEIDLCRRFESIELEQLQWRRMMLAGPPYNENPEKFDQEYPTDLQTAFLSGGWALFGMKTIKRLMSHTRHPVFVGDVFWGESDERNNNEPIHELVRRPQILHRGDSRARGFASHDNDGDRECLRVYRWPERGERLFIGGDIGGGSKDTKDGDFSVWQVVSQNPWGPDEQIITWRGRCSAMRFAEIGATLAWKLRYLVGDEVPMPTLAPEYTGPGKTTCVYLDEKYLYEVYRYQAPGVHGLPKSKHVGWESNYNTKPQMVNYLIGAVEKDGLRIRDEATVLEMSAYRQFSKDDDLAFGGASGVHDDLISALQIANVLSRWHLGTGSTEMPVSIDSLDDPDAETWDPFRAQPSGEEAWSPFDDLEWTDDTAGSAIESASFYAIEP